jgi:hypothetical protein
MNILAAYIIVLLVSLVFTLGHSRGDYSVISVVLFFVILFMAGLASLYWLPPYAPLVWGIAWLPLFFTVLIFSLLLASPPLYYRRGRVLKRETVEDGTSTTVSVFIWSLLFLLLIVVVAGIFRAPAL